MSALRLENCAACGQPVIRRGRTVINTRGIPLTHALTCASKTPGAESAGLEEEDTE